MFSPTHTGAECIETGDFRVQISVSCSWLTKQFTRTTVLPGLRRCWFFVRLQLPEPPLSAVGKHLRRNYGHNHFRWQGIWRRSLNTGSAVPTSSRGRGQRFAQMQLPQREALQRADVPSQKARRVLRRRQPHPSHDRTAHRSEGAGQRRHLFRSSHAAPAKAQRGRRRGWPGSHRREQRPAHPAGAGRGAPWSRRGEGSRGRALRGREGGRRAASSCPQWRSAMGQGAGGEA